MTEKTQMPALPLEGGKLNVLTLSDLSATPLAVAIDPNRNAKAEVEFAARDPELKALAAELLPQLVNLAAPAGENGVMQALDPVIFYFPPPKRHPAELKAWASNYKSGLKDYPLCALHYAVEKYKLTTKIHAFPTVADIILHAEDYAVRIRCAADRCRKIAEYAPPPRRETPEERRAFMIARGYMTPDGKLVPLGAAPGEVKRAYA